MYTRCPECATVFLVTAEQLRMAHGDVRCGNCTKSFNALLSLMDERPHYDEDTGAASPEESIIESEEDLEFDAPEQSWQSFFIAAEPGPAMAPTEPPPAEAADEPAGELQSVSHDEPPDERLDEPLDEHTGEHEEWRGMLTELAGQSDDGGDDASDADGDQGADDSPVYSVGDEADYEDDDPTNEHPIIQMPEEAQEIAAEPEAQADSGIHWVLEDTDEEQSLSQDPGQVKEAQAAPITQFAYVEYAENVTPEPEVEVLDQDPADTLPPWISEARLDEAFPEPATRTSPRWYAVGAVLLILLIMQLIHHNRDSLAAHPTYGSAVRALYSAVDVPLFPTWGLESYEVTGSDAVAGRSAPVALDVLAEVAIKSTKPVGLPLVRVVLRDRWSNPVANRVFKPAEYAPGTIDPNTVTPPGATIPFEISVTDPGTDALGYLVDICLPHRTEGLQCQLARNPFKR